MTCLVVKAKMRIDVNDVSDTYKYAQQRFSVQRLI